LDVSIATFETERLVLRGVAEVDAPSYERYFVDWEVVRHLGGPIPWPYPSGGILEFIRNDVLPSQGRDRWVWGIFR
jgi:ribosomal-protein-alanine N-acetyltransferase